MQTNINRLARKVEHSYNVDPVMVEQHLAITPSEMNKRAAQGIPIGANVLPHDMFAEGHEGTDSSVPYLAQRGIDFSDAAVYTQNSKAALRRAAKNANVK